MKSQRPSTNGAAVAAKRKKEQEAVNTCNQLGESPSLPTALEAAHHAVNGKRMENYGDQLTNFTNIADMWTVLLRDKLIEPITPQDVAQCQIALKQARLMKTGGKHRDSIVDVAGYAECLDQINHLQREQSYGIPRSDYG